MYEEVIEGLAHFTLEDAEEPNLCVNCEHLNNCAFIAYANKLSVKRDGEGMAEKWGCSTLFEEAKAKEGTV